MQQETVNVFIAYSRKDEEIKDRLKTALKVLQRVGYIDSIWDDSAIEAGSEWEKAIHNQLDSADIILLLVSHDFLASDYCFGTEMSKALKAHEEEKSKVIPIIVRHCSWDITELKKLQALPDNGKPIVDKWDTESIPYHQIERSLMAIAMNIKNKKHLIKQKEQFEYFLQKGEENYSAGIWNEALVWYDKAFKIHDVSFELEYEHIAGLVELCKKQVKFKELIDQAKTAFENNEILGSFHFVKEALEINVSFEAKALLEETSKILYVDTIKKADAQFLNMNWNEAHKRHESAFKYINEANLIEERKIIRRRDFSYQMVSVLEKIERGNEQAKEQIRELLIIARGF